MILDLQTLRVKQLIKIKKGNMKKQFLDVEGISEYLTMSKSCIYKKVAAKEIPHHKIGARTLFDIDEINMWVKSDGTLSESGEVSFMDIKSFLD